MPRRAERAGAQPGPRTRGSPGRLRAPLRRRCAGARQVVCAYRPALGAGLPHAESDAGSGCATADGPPGVYGTATRTRSTPCSAPIFRANPGEFHTPEGHAFWAEQIVALNALNPQVAARMARALERWRSFHAGLATASMQEGAGNGRRRHARTCHRTLPRSSARRWASGVSRRLKARTRLQGLDIR
jgi:hypothetical protein